jgi:hypothetical protein
VFRRVRSTDRTRGLGVRRLHLHPTPPPKMATSTFMGNALVNKVVARTQGSKQVTTCLFKKAAPKAAKKAAPKSGKASSGKAVKVRQPLSPFACPCNLSDRRRSPVAEHASDWAA